MTKSRSKREASRAVSPKDVQKPKSRISVTVTNHELPHGSCLSRDIPDSVKIAIASAIMAFAEMEMNADAVIWRFLDISIDDGKLLMTNASITRFDVLGSGLI